jgi:hypothetical protein
MNEAMDKAQELNAEHKSLYRAGKGADEVLPVVAPFLFTYPQSQEFADFVLQEGWGDSWGIWVDSYADFESLWKHFRKFLTVMTEDSQQFYFRFYDPRVLRIFLPTCDVYQLKDFFGPVDQYIMEDEDPAQAIIFSLKKGILQTSVMPKEEILSFPSFNPAKPKSFWETF